MIVSPKRHFEKVTTYTIIIKQTIHNLRNTKNIIKERVFIEGKLWLTIEHISLA